MMKIVLLVALVSYVIAQSTECPATNCVNTNGASCATGTNNVCDATANLYCSGGASCVPTIAQGQSCSQNDVSGHQCGYTTVTCQQADGNVTNDECLNRYVLPGLPCSSDSQCFYGNSNGATNSTCVSNKCYGAIGTSCTYPGYYQCPYGSYCSATATSAGVCTATAAGAACTNTGSADRTCPTGYCTGDSTCGNRFTGTSGSACVGDEDCGEGLFCANSGTGADNTCHANVASSNTACTGVGMAGACTANFETCVCNGQRSTVCTAPRGNPAGLAAAANAFYTCVNANPNCAANLDPWCSQCISQTCNYYNLKLGSNYAYDSCSMSAAQRAQAAKCRSSTSSSANVVASLAVVSAAAFALLV